MDPTSIIDTLSSGGAVGILAVTTVAGAIAFWREKQAHDKTRADHAVSSREDLANILNTTNQVTNALSSVEKAVFGQSRPNV